jgi:hypothetical protein
MWVAIFVCEVPARARGSTRPRGARTRHCAVSASAALVKSSLILARSGDCAGSCRDSVMPMQNAARHNHMSASVVRDIMCHSIPGNDAAAWAAHGP